MNENEYEELNPTPPELETIVSKFERLSLIISGITDDFKAFTRDWAYFPESEEEIQHGCLNW